MVLQDHKKIGRVLVPPFTHMLGPLHEISWIKTILPELLWISLIHKAHGDRRGVEIITRLTRSIRENNKELPHKWLAPASSYSSISSENCEELKGRLSDAKMLVPLCEALTPLVSWYPECPLAPIIASGKAHRSKKALSALKATVSDLYARSERSTMMAQATAVWLAFDADILKVSPDISLANFPEIENYPHSELSKEIGAGIRSTLNAFFGSAFQYQNDSVWPNYFWNRGLAIDPCEIDR